MSAFIRGLKVFNLRKQFYFYTKMSILQDQYFNTQEFDIEKCANSNVDYCQSDVLLNVDSFFQEKNIFDKQRNVGIKLDLFLKSFCTEGRALIIIRVNFGK